MTTTDPPGMHPPVDPAVLDPAEVDLDTVDLSDDDFWVLPPGRREAAFAALRERDPLHFYAEPEFPGLVSGPGYYAVTRHADAEEISTQPQLFCSGQGAVSILDLPVELSEFFGSMISMDDPRHNKIRKVVSRAFSPRMLERLVGRVDELAVEILSAARGRALDGDGSFDLVAEVAAPLPLQIICDLMGIAPEHHQLVVEKTSLILSGADPEFVEDREQAIGLYLQAGADLAELMTELSVERQKSPTDDLTSALVTTEVEGDALTHQEIASFFILLCVAGNETTRNAISHGVLALDANPDQKALWQADRDIGRTAVEEIVRWATPVIWMRRTATRDVTVGGQQFGEGEKFVLFYNSANRDAAVFDRPYAFDVRRDPNPHVGFGARGPHFCLGAHLARREIAVVFNRLFEQMPELAVAGEPDRLRSSFVNGIKRLPVTLRPS